jgi:predicted transglutaminase-like cysteine proteinase
MLAPKRVRIGAQDAGRRPCGRASMAVDSTRARGARRAGRRASSLARSLAVSFIVALAAAPAAAAPKKPVSVSPEARAAESRPANAAPAPARFFTLNELLAKGDRGAKGQVAAIEPGDIATDADAVPATINGPEPFGLYSFRAPEGTLWMKWRALEADLQAEAKTLAQCGADAKSCAPEALRLAAMVDETRSRDGRARLETANRLVNGALRYVTDYEQHGLADRWTAPLAALAAGRGDCEEYAIMKYVVLRAAGMEESELRLVLVRDRQIRIDHAVLAARFEGRWLVLDNRKSGVVETADVRHYQPLYALGAGGVKLFAAPYANWGEGAAGFDALAAGWTLRGSDGQDFAADWTLRGIDDGGLDPTIDAEPAAENF